MNIEVTYQGKKVEVFQVAKLFSVRYDAEGESEHGKALRVMADVGHYMADTYLQLGVGSNYANMESAIGWRRLKPGNDTAWKELPLQFLEEHPELLFPDDERFSFQVTD